VGQNGLKDGALVKVVAGLLNDTAESSTAAADSLAPGNM
jgi:hypothetical protein